MKTILFVDDNEILCRLSCDILRRAGYRAVPAFNGEQALEVFQQESFDILITDMRMDGMNGVELAQAVHNHSPELPVIMVTAYGPVEHAHIRTCIAKEGLFPTLLEKIRFCLSEAESQNLTEREPITPQARQ